MTHDITELSDGYHTFGELYEHRAALLAALMKSRPDISWIAPSHHDDTRIPGFFIVGMNLSTGQISYHVPDNWWGVYERTGAQILTRAPVWDKHTPDDVVNRLVLWSVSVDV